MDEALAPYKFAGIQLTVKAVEATKAHFIALHRKGLEGIERVNPSERWAYRAKTEHLIAQYEEAPVGEFPDLNLTVLQYAHYVQTGTMVALLP